MAKKLYFQRKAGVHRHRHRNGRRITYRKGDIIVIEDISEFGSCADSWRQLKKKEAKKISKDNVAKAEALTKAEKKEAKKRAEAKEKALSKRKISPPKPSKVKFPDKAVDGVETKDFVRDVDLMFNDVLRQTYIDPGTSKVYWLSEDGYLSPINEDDSPPRGKDGEVIGDIKSDEPPLGLKAIHTGGGWYDVINEKTGEAINDNKLRKEEAENLIDGKIVEDTENMAGGKGDNSRRRAIIVDDPEQ